MKTTDFICLKCNAYVDAQHGVRVVRCPSGHRTNSISRTSLGARAIQFALVAVGILFIPLIARIGYKLVFSKPMPVNTAYSALFMLLLAVFFVLMSVVSLIRWQKRRQPIGGPSAAYAKDQLARAVGQLTGVAIFFLSLAGLASA